MIDFIKKRFTLKTALYSAGLLLIIALLWISIKFLSAYTSVRHTTRDITTKHIEKIPELEGWNHPETQELWKEKIWLENQLSLGKQDSMGLGINFSDSVIHLQFKGLSLVESKMICKIPKNFLRDIDSRVYVNYFGKPDTIVTSYSNVAKKPIKRVRIDSLGNSIPVDTSATVNRIMHWEFITTNQIRFVINGISSNPDSVDINSLVNRDIRKYRRGRKIKEGIEKGYMPVVFIWLDNDEAKALYRALPYRATMITKN